MLDHCYNHERCCKCGSIDSECRYTEGSQEIKVYSNALPNGKSFRPRIPESLLITCANCRYSWHLPCDDATDEDKELIELYLNNGALICQQDTPQE